MTVHALSTAETPPELPAPPRTLGLVAAVEAGDRRAVLAAQQLEVAQLIEDGAGSQTAQLHRTLITITDRLAELDDSLAVAQRPRTPDEPFDRAAISS